MPSSSNDLKSWKALRNSSENFVPDLKGWFEKDSKRAERFSIDSAHIFYDYSRQLIDKSIFSLLIKLAEESGLRNKIEDMFCGKKINITEDRSVLHAALRNISGAPVLVDGKDVMPGVNSVLEKIKVFSGEIHSGKRKGVTGKKLTTIVSVGIGGSYLGPEYLAESCRPYAKEGMRLIFIANVDGADFTVKTTGINPEETLFVIVSKTFTTAETMKNAGTAKEWMQNKLGDSPDVIKKHFIAVSTAKDKVKAFGIDTENMFAFWGWVGGRFSATSAVGGVPLSLYLGFDNFRKVLEGARWMDEHFRKEPFEKNIPVVCALLDIWNINFLGLKSRALLPYSQLLGKLPAHTQQVEMESNGKSVDIEGKELGFDTGEVVFGEPGTNGQHSFYQLIHQGTQVIPCDFIGFVKPQYEVGVSSLTEVSHHEELMTNFFAQPDALAFGKDDELPQKRFSGNRPSSSLLLKELTPFTAGALLALTEHRAAAKGFIWGINSFDQFGVELGKKLGIKIREEMLKKHKDSAYKFDTGNSSTDEMMELFFKG
ncbi:MAG: glucose-6-phosphate isomerase [Candidatus Margulisiibacteriota bacterium]